MDLTEDEIFQILRYIEESHFDELQLKVDDLRLIVRKGGHVSITRGELPPSARTELDESGIPSLKAEERESETKEQIIESEAESALEHGLIAIRAPMLGIFYIRPETGAPPYVEVGTLVKEDDTVCLIEVMKTFSAVQANVHGCIDKICAESGQLVEYGRILFLVRPEKSP